MRPAHEQHTAKMARAEWLTSFERGLLVGRYGSSFWARVEKTDDCWVWRGPVRNHGYGVLYLRIRGKNRSFRAHRLSWEINQGPIPPGKMVLHHCDNRRCVRPSHLYVGTAADNAKDSVRRGRSARGERNGQSKLTDSAVMRIRERCVSGETQQSVADSFGVARSVVSGVMTRKIWSHVPDTYRSDMRVQIERFRRSWCNNWRAKR